MHSDQLSPIGGEFADSSREALFQAERLPETIRHTRRLFLLFAILNALFFVSDWRFYGDPHFLVAIPARTVTVAVAVAAYLWLAHARSFRHAQTIMVLWEGITAVAVALLVTSHSDIAFIVALLMPAIYYLAVPTAFRLSVLSGAGCSALMLAAYMLPGPLPPTLPGLALAEISANVALLLTIANTNRLRRQEWAATQSERRAKEALAANQRMLENMFMAVPIPLLVTGVADGSLIRANDAAYAYFGGDPVALGIHRAEQIYDDPGDRTALLEALRRDGRVTGFETRIRVADGTQRDVLLAATAIAIDGSPCAIVGVVDITNRKELESHLQWLATTDPLTGLANRNRFFAVANAEVQRAQRYDHPLAMLMIDLDHFKRINDSYGHEMGDLALKAFAALCRRALRPHDLVARVGGEEFAVLLPETGRADALDVAERLRRDVQTLRPSEAWPDLAITVSIGMATVTPEDRSADNTLARADRALYAAKRSGRNCVVDQDANDVPAGLLGSLQAPPV